MRSKRTLSLLVLALLVAVSACSSGDDTESSDSTTSGSAAGTDADVLTIFASENLEAVLPEVVTAFEASASGATVEVVYDTSNNLAERIDGGEVPDVYIDRSQKVRDVVGEDDPGIALLGEDPVAIVVAPGDTGVGTAAFGDDPTVTALCVDEVPCGIAARAALDGDGVTPAPDLEGDDWEATLAYVTGGEAAAAILFRTEYLTAGDQVAIIALDGSGTRVVTYELVAMSDSSDAEAFVTWVTDDRSATDALAAVGLRDVPQGGGSDATQP